MRFALCLCLLAGGSFIVGCSDDDYTGSSTTTGDGSVDAYVDLSASESTDYAVPTDAAEQTD